MSDQNLIYSKTFKLDSLEHPDHAHELSLQIQESIRLSLQEAQRNFNLSLSQLEQAPEELTAAFASGGAEFQIVGQCCQNRSLHEGPYWSYRLSMESMFPELEKQLSQVKGMAGVLVIGGAIGGAILLVFLMYLLGAVAGFFILSVQLTFLFVVGGMTVGGWIGKRIEQWMVVMAYRQHLTSEMIEKKEQLEAFLRVRFDQATSGFQRV